MRKRRFRKYVLPSLFIIVSISMFFGIAVLNNILLRDDINYNYSKSLMKDATQAVLSEQKEGRKVFYKPYGEKDVDILVAYYDKDATDEEKEKALIVYENTYMPSTGIIYGSDDEIDVIVVLDGKVTNIKTDDILGTMMEITHDTNLITYYYSLKEVHLKVGDAITAGTILGKATTNNIYNQKNNFLFEVYYQGKSMNPETFYKMNELQ